jgi:hypothetical protein
VIDGKSGARIRRLEKDRAIAEGVAAVLFGTAVLVVLALAAQMMGVW